MAESNSGRRLKMKALQAETGLSKQAIAFYLREGLLPEPEKPKPNVAYYTDEHVQRIQTIKRMQHDRAMPLREIKALLESFDNQPASFRADLGNFELALQARMDGDMPGPDQTLATVREMTGISADELAQLDDAGIITIKHKNKKARLDFRDFGIVQCWVQFQQAGYADKEWFSPEFLSPLAKTLQTITESIVTNFFDEFEGTPTEEAAQKGAEGVAIVNNILTRLHTQSILRAVRSRIENEALAD